MKCLGSLREMYCQPQLHKAVVRKRRHMVSLNLMEAEPGAKGSVVSWCPGWLCAGAGARWESILLPLGRALGNNCDGKGQHASGESGP